MTSAFRTPGHAALPRLACIVSLLALLGCATSDYQYGNFTGRPPEELTRTSLLIEQGGPDRTLDTMAYVVETPQRVLPFLPQVQRHELSPETTEKLTNYLRNNDLADVKVQVNEYDPAGQWRLLRENTRIAAGWRYTAGAWSLLSYTLFPGRVFGVNSYYIYTNTLNLNSDRPAVLLREAAVAKDIHSRRWPGTYAAYTSLPGLALIRRMRSVNEVVSYARFVHDWETEKQAYRVLYPAVGMESTTLGVPIFSPLIAWWYGPILQLGGAAIGGITGYAVSSYREAQVKKAVTPWPQPAGPIQPVGFSSGPVEERTSESTPPLPGFSPQP
jgi:hypothetical protein